MLSFRATRRLVNARDDDGDGDDYVTSYSLRDDQGRLMGVLTFFGTSKLPDYPPKATVTLEGA